jgi:hypothetical protein
MRKFTRSWVIGCLVGGVPAATAVACESSYDPATQVASIPCVGITGGTQAFAVSLQSTGGNNLALTSSSELVVQNPSVSSLKILTTPVPVAIIYGNYSSGCTSAYGRPSFIQAGNNIDIRLKSRAPLGAICTAVAPAFVEVVGLPADVTSHPYTYSVNGTSITPTY